MIDYVKQQIKKMEEIVSEKPVKKEEPYLLRVEKEVIQIGKKKFKTSREFEINNSVYLNTFHDKISVHYPVGTIFVNLCDLSQESQEKRGLCTVPKEVYDTLQEKLRIKGKEEWSSEKHCDAQIMINTLLRSFGKKIPDKEKIREYKGRITERDQTLPAELELLAENPGLHLQAKKEIEKEVIELFENIKIKGLEQARKYKNVLNLAKACGVAPRTAHEKIKKQLNKMEASMRKDYKQKLREIRELKEG